MSASKYQTIHTILCMQRQYLCVLHRGSEKKKQKQIEGVLLVQREFMPVLVWQKRRFHAFAASTATVTRRRQTIQCQCTQRPPPQTPAPCYRNKFNIILIGILYWCHWCCEDWLYHIGNDVCFHLRFISVFAVLPAASPASALHWQEIVCSLEDSYSCFVCKNIAMLHEQLFTSCLLSLLYVIDRRRLFWLSICSPYPFSSAPPPAPSAHASLPSSVAPAKLFTSLRREWKASRK